MLTISDEIKPGNIETTANDEFLIIYRFNNALWVEKRDCCRIVTLNTENPICKTFYEILENYD